MRKREVLRRTMALLLGLVLLVTGCGSGQSSDGKKQKQESSSTSISWGDERELAWAAQEVSPPEGVDPENFQAEGLVQDGKELVTLAWSFSGEESERELVRFPSDGSAGSVTSLRAPAGETFLCAALDERGGVCALTAAAGEEQTYSRVRLVHFTAKGEQDLDKVIVRHPDEDYTATSLAQREGKTLVSDSRGIFLYDGTSGERKKKLGEASDDGAVQFLADGTPVIMEGTGDDAQVRELGGKERSTPISGYVPQYALTPAEGRDFFVCDTEGVSRYTLGKKKRTRCVGALASDLPADQAAGVCALSEGGYALLVPDAQGNASLFLLTGRKDISKQTQLILGGESIDQGVLDQVVRFNRANEKYRVVVHDYAAYREESGGQGLDPLERDIVSGKGPDLLILDDGMPVQSFAAKGLFLDLTDRMREAGVLSKEKYLTNVSEAFSLKQKHFFVVPSFGVWVVCGRQKDLGDGRVTLADVKKIAKKRGLAPEKIFGWGTEQLVLSYGILIGGDRYIDWEKKTCSFDSPDFLAFLEYVKSLPKKANKEMGTDALEQIRSGKALLYFADLDSIDTYRQILQGGFAEPVTMTGFPGGEAKLCRPELVAGERIAVSAASEHADGAWAFARSFLEPSYQDHLSDAGDSNGLPVLRSSLQARVRRAMRKEDSTYMIGNTQLKYRPLSEGEAQELLDFFDGVDAAGGMDRQILNIILEETKGYLAGQKSAQEVSKVIQSRVKTYIQEKS